MANIVLSPSPLNVPLGEQSFLNMDFRGIISCQVQGVDDNTMETLPFEFLGFTSAKFAVKLKPTAPVGLLSSLFLICQTMFGTSISSNEIKVFGEDSNIVADPHFFQIVYDSKKNATESICYDVTGKSGQLIIIARNDQIDTTVYGRLKDDYYMHEIIVSSSNTNFTVGLKNIKINNQIIEWASTWTKVYTVENFTYKMTNSKIDINIDDDTFPTISVTRGVHGISSMHLNVEFSSTRNIKGGLMGHVNKNDYQFYNSVQRFSAYGAVKVNNFMAPAWLKTMGHQSCWYMALKNLLAPSTIEDYLRD